MAKARLIPAIAGKEQVQAKSIYCFTHRMNYVSVTKTCGPTKEQGVCDISRQLMLARAMCPSCCPFDPVKHELKGVGTRSEPRSA